MKNTIKLFFIAIVAFVSSCDKKQQVNETGLFNAEYEMQKPYQLVKVISASLEAFDAFGNPLIFGEWYIRSTKSEQLIPIMSDETFYRSDFENADDKEGNSLLQMTGEVRSDTVKIFSTSEDSWNAEVKIILLGERQVKLLYRSGVSINITN